MAKEIERKFLVIGEFKHLAHKSVRITQGYIVSDKNKSVRIRLTDTKGFLTIKGKSENGGLSRFEWEKEISQEEANSLFELCKENFIDKTRYYIQSGNHTIEVDVFHGENEGLIVAEIELKEENEKISKPDFIGEEVTGIAKYYNSQLTKHPYKNW